MASRPRPSLLALFDPLTISDPSLTTPTREAFSPSPSLESGSDKENVVSATPKGSCRKTCNGESDICFTKGSHSKDANGMTIDCGSQADLLGSSFSLVPKDDDASNLCLVELAHELDSACKTTDLDDIVQRGQAPREPLAEISFIPSNGSNRTPPSVARDKRLINLDSPSTTPKSLRKFAAGINKYGPSTPPVSSPLGSARTPRNLSPNIDPSFVIRDALPNVESSHSVHRAPLVPFASYSPSLLSSTPASDPKPAFYDPPSSQLGSSFEIHGPSYMKKMDLSGDLLKDDLSFLERLEEDSFADFGRGNSSDRTTSSSPKTPQEISNDESNSEQKPNLMQKDHCIMRVEDRHSVKVETPARKASTMFRRSSSHSGLLFGSKRADLSPDSINLSSPIRLEPRNPLTSPSISSNGKRHQTLAPKKSQGAIRRSNTLSRCSSACAAGTVKEHSNDEQHAKSVSLRPRPSSVEIKLPARSQLFTVKEKGATRSNDSSQSTLARRASISRPPLTRRISVGRGLSPTRPTVTEPIPKQEKIQKPSLASSVGAARRLSVSTSSKPTPIKANNFATTGRMGGARRVPLTTNAAFFKANETTISEVQSPKPVPRATSVGSRIGPQRPPTNPGLSTTLGQSAPGPNVSSFNKAPSASLTSRTLGRTAAVSSAVFSRSSFMTSSASNVASTSRLPMPPSKSTSRIPGSGARKAF